MRFLCLHGSGTNAKIFEAQLAALRHELAKDDVSFDFLDGECEHAPDAGIRGLFDGPYLSYYTLDVDRQIPPGEKLAEAQELILTVVEEEGPFDGIIGFSQGAALAASILIHRTATHPLEPPYGLFRCAIFMCGSLPWNYDGNSRLEPAHVSPLIQIPTAHIVGAKDDLYEESLRLYAMCEKHNAVLYDHGGAHMIPTERKITLAMAEAIRTTIRRAAFIQ